MCIKVAIDCYAVSFNYIYANIAYMVYLMNWSVNANWWTFSLANRTIMM